LADKTVEDLLEGDLEKLEQAEEMVQIRDFLQKTDPGVILAFVTGNTKKPALGFQPPPSTHFEQEEGKRHTASTCSNIFILINNTRTQSLKGFIHIMIEALMGGGNFFGKV
jgi:hypothetical protein